MGDTSLEFHLNEECKNAFIDAIESQCGHVIFLEEAERRRKEEGERRRETARSRKRRLEAATPVTPKPILGNQHLDSLPGQESNTFVLCSVLVLLLLLAGLLYRYLNRRSQARKWARRNDLKAYTFPSRESLRMTL